VRKEDVPDPPPELKLRPVDPREWMLVWRRVLADAPVKNVGSMLAARADYRTGANSHPGIELLMLMTGIKSDKTVRDSRGGTWKAARHLSCKRRRAGKGQPTSTG
jgi:hypothetical protein